jgi:hypothetical protein
MDAELVRRPYRAPRPRWDHDHCAVCWTTFAEQGTVGADRPDALTACYDDFRARLRWRLAGPITSA